MSFNVQLVGEVEVMHTRLTFAERGNSSPVGGSAAHVVEAGGSQLIGGVRLETCTEWFGSLVHIIDYGVDQLFLVTEPSLIHGA